MVVTEEKREKDENGLVEKKKKSLTLESSFTSRAK